MQPAEACSAIFSAYMGTPQNSTLKSDTTPPPPLSRALLPSLQYFVLYGYLLVVYRTTPDSQTLLTPLLQPLSFPRLVTGILNPCKLRATVVDLSDAVRGRASIWSVDGLSGEGASDEDLLEHVGLLEDLPNASICEVDGWMAAGCPLCFYYWPVVLFLFLLLLCVFLFFLLLCAIFVLPLVVCFFAFLRIVYYIQRFGLYWYDMLEEFRATRSVREEPGCPGFIA